MISLNPDTERLMLAMAEFEGWDAPGPNEADHVSRSYRNHNPGNLRSSPFQSHQKDGFAVFSNDSVGWMAFHYDLMQKAKGNTVTDLNGESTIAELIRVWAPPSDNNDTENYIDFVERKSTLDRDTKLKELFGK